MAEQTPDTCAHCGGHHFETKITLPGTLNTTDTTPFTADDWRGLAAICELVLRVATQHRDEIGAALRRHNSTYRAGSFVAPLYALREAAEAEVAAEKPTAHTRTR